jgi:hypothetical protein
LIAKQYVWERFKQTWLQRTNGKIFHASDCESDHGDFAVTSANSHDDNLRLYADLVRILAQSGVRGYAAALDVAAWIEVFPEVPKDVGYYKCFTEVIKHFSYTSDYHDGTELEFTFDQRQESQYNAGLLYNYFVAMPECKERNVFMGATVNFGSREDVRIQAADIVAREAMKHLDNFGKRGMRRSMQALAELPGGPFKFDFFTRDYCTDTRAKWSELEKVTGMTPETYASWLNANRLVDNWSNRFRFVHWLNVKDGENEHS